ncbi:MAG: ATP-binding protein [Bacillota bacterium]|jgi:DNA helicase HerA-like ATPase
MMRRRKHLGVITRGSLLEGIEMKLASHINVEEIKAGKFVVISGRQTLFFCMITDVRLDAANPEILLNPPGADDALFREVLAGTSTYVTVSLRPLLTLPRSEEAASERRDPLPVKTIPPHFAEVFEAEEEDVNRIFGSEQMAPHYFNIGQPLDMETPVCLNLNRFVERSNGIFGKTGTGKTFLTRVVLAGLIRQRAAVNFVFDMHNEYGWDSRREDGSFVRGLRQIFGSQVAIFTLDPASARRRGVAADCDVYIPYSQITVEDIAPLQEELRLNNTAVEAAYLVAAQYKESWLEVLLSQSDIKEFAEQVGAHPESLSALYRKLKRIESFPFIVKGSQGSDAVDRIMECLSRGVHVVLEFGQQNSMLCYLLVANIITRRIHELYVRQTEKYLATRDTADQPRQLVITIEEAHKFLNPTAARQTIFGTIAREMRKYYVSLLVVDQRPSGIDDEVLSQLGTRITALLNDEKDIQAVLTGVSNTSGLRGVLASLDTRQQALVIGHAVPMPVVIKTRTYDEEFFRAMGALTGEEKQKKLVRDVISLFGEEEEDGR